LRRILNKLPFFTALSRQSRQVDATIKSWLLLSGAGLFKAVNAFAARKIKVKKPEA
jgi:hypothetical protein